MYCTNLIYCTNKTEILQILGRYLSPYREAIYRLLIFLHTDIRINVSENPSLGTYEGDLGINYLWQVLENMMGETIAHTCISLTITDS